MIDRPLADPIHRSPDEPLLTVVIPTYNERENIGVVYERIAAALDPRPFAVIVVDDDSPDGTSAVVEALARSDPRISVFVRTGQRGLAGACIEGMLAARSDLVAVMDADLQHEPATIVPMLDRMLSAACDVVIASRYIDAREAEAFSPLRSALSRLGNRLVRTFLHVRTSDPMSGFFMLRRDIVVRSAPRLNRDGFKLLADILSEGGRRLRTEDVPYVFGSRLQGSSKLDEKVLFDFIVLLVAKALFGVLPVRFVSFALIGLLGLVVHLTLLATLLYGAGASFLVSQTVATLAAMTANFFLNNILTYRDQRIARADVPRGLALFWLSCSLGAFNNILVASQVFAWTGLWLPATVSGIVVGAFCNYVLSAVAVWRRFDGRTRWFGTRRADIKAESSPEPRV